MGAPGSEQQTQEAVGWVGGTVRDAQGRRMGRLEAVLVDRQSLVAEWLALRSGRFAGRLVLVPRHGCTGDDGTICLPYERDQVLTAPMCPNDQPVSPHHEQVLCWHYTVPLTRGARRASWERRTAVSSIRTLADLDRVQGGDADGVAVERRRPSRRTAAE